MSLSTAQSTQPTAPTHSWRRAFADLPREHGFEPLRVEGRLPDDLIGTLYRNGAALFSAQGARYRHWFDGDGAISAVRFGEGKAKGAVKVVEGRQLLAERAAGRPMYGTYGTPPTGNLFQRLRRMVKNNANTSVIVWQDRLFALMEGAPPTEVSSEDLSTVGETNLEKIILQNFSAHPHRVPGRAASYNFATRFGGRPALDLYELPDVGRPRRMGTVPLSGGTMVHDFIATQNHLIFFAPPLRLRLLGLLLGRKSFGDSLEWRPEVGTEVLVVPIDRPQEVIRFTTGPFYQWHFANAFEQAPDELAVDFVRLPDFESNRWLGTLVNSVPETTWGGRLGRARIDLKARTLRYEQHWDVHCEFPRINAAQAGQRHRYVYLASSSTPEAARGLFDVLTRFDNERGTATSVSLGSEQYPSEPVFVRKAASLREDDGYLLTLVYDGASHESHVAVLDASNLERGPLARAYFGHHIPFTFHGNFARASSR